MYDLAFSNQDCRFSPRGFCCCAVAMAGRASKRAVERRIVRVVLGRMMVTWKITLRMISEDATLEEVVVTIRYWLGVEVKGSSAYCIWSISRMKVISTCTPWRACTRNSSKLQAVPLHPASFASPQFMKIGSSGAQDAACTACYVPSFCSCSLMKYEVDPLLYHLVHATRPLLDDTSAPRTHGKARAHCAHDHDLLSRDFQ